MWAAGKKMVTSVGKKLAQLLTKEAMTSAAHVASSASKNLLMTLVSHQRLAAWFNKTAFGAKFNATWFGKWFNPYVASAR